MNVIPVMPKNNFQANLEKNKKKNVSFEGVGKLSFPKKGVAKVEDGFDKFDENLLCGLKKIILKGGKIEKKIKAEEITVCGGKHIGINANLVKLIGEQNSGKIVAGKLKARGAKLNVPITVNGNAKLQNSSTNCDFIVKGDLKNYGKTIINEGTVVKGDMENFDFTQVNGGKVKENMYNYGNTKINNGIVKIMVNHDFTKVNGGTVRNFMSNYGNSQIFGGIVKGNMFNHGNSEHLGGVVNGFIRKSDF